MQAILDLRKSIHPFILMILLTTFLGPRQYSQLIDGGKSSPRKGKNYLKDDKKSLKILSTLQKLIFFSAMVRYIFVNKGAFFLSFSMAYLIILLFNISTSSKTIQENPLISNFGIIIDAGSTGSRLFLYKWTSPSDKELINIRTVFDDRGKAVVKKVIPGLSTFAQNPKAAAEYIMPLLEFASENIPEEKIKETPVFIFATAGMRLLPISQQNLIIENLRKDLPKHTKLKVEPENIKVITGKWEGIYSWIAVNYMLDRFNLTNIPDFSKEMEKLERPKTAGMIDMGGASAQIAFELAMDDNSLMKNENMEIVNLGSRNDEKRFLYRIFVTTFLGFGVNEGAKKYEKFLWEKFKKEGKDLKEDAKLMKTNTKIIEDGCLPVNFLKLTSIEAEEEEEGDQQFVRKGNGNWDKCVSDIANLIFEDNPKCPKIKSCFFGGVDVPPKVSLSTVELYGFSEYWFSVDNVLSLGGIYDHDKFEQKAKEFCKQNWRTIKKKFRSKFYPKADNERLEMQCFKSAWIHAILHNGFYVDEFNNHFQSAFRINGQEVQWALGAMIYQQRYFPLESKNEQNEGQRTMKLVQKLDENNNNRRTTFYLIFFVLAMMAFFYGMWRNRRIQRIRQNGGGKSFRYKRLDKESSPDPD